MAPAAPTFSIMGCIALPILLALIVWLALPALRTPAAFFRSRFCWTTLALIALALLPSFVVTPLIQSARVPQIPYIPLEGVEPSNELLVYSTNSKQRYEVTDDELAAIPNVALPKPDEREQSDAPTFVAESPGAPVTLPGGSVVRLIAQLVIIPEARVSSDGKMEITPSIQIYRPDGSPGDDLPQHVRDELIEISEEHKGDSSLPSVWLYFEQTNIDRNQGDHMSLEAGLEFWHPTQPVKYPNRRRMSSTSGRSDSIVEKEYHLTPFVFHHPYRIEALFEGFETPLEFKPLEPGASATFEDKTFTILSIRYVDWDENDNPILIEWTEAGKTSLGAPTGNGYDDRFKLEVEFNKAIPLHTDIWNHFSIPAEDGERPTRYGHGMRSEDGIHFRVSNSGRQESFESTTHIRVDYDEQYARVVWEMPGLPGLPKHDGNVLEAKIPLIRGDQIRDVYRAYLGWDQIGGLRNTGYYQNRRLYDLLQEDIQGKFGDSMFAAGNEILVRNGRVIAEFDAGSTRAALRPGWHRLMTALGSRDLGVAAVFWIVLLARLALEAFGMATRNRLLALGYDALRRRHAIHLWLAVGRRARDLPRREELEMIPGVQPDDPRALIRLIRRQTPAA